MLLSQAVFLYCCPDCLSCPANVIQISQATWSIWAAINKNHHKLRLHALVFVQIEGLYQVHVQAEKKKKCSLIAPGFSSGHPCIIYLHYINIITCLLSLYVNAYACNGWT